MAAADRLAGEAGGDEPPERLAGEPTPAKSLSLTDPAAAWTSDGSRKACFASAINTLVDLKRAIVVDVAATPARRSDEVAPTSVMIERTGRCFGLLPSRLAGDAASGTGLLMDRLRRQGIEPSRMRPWPVLDGERQKAKGLFGRADFALDHERDVYVCPSGHDRRTTGAIIPGGLKQYRARPASCGPCALIGFAAVLVVALSLAAFLAASRLAGGAAGRPTWLFGRAAGRDRLAALGFRAAFALALLSPLLMAARPALAAIDPLWGLGGMVSAMTGLLLAVAGAMLA